MYNGSTIINPPHHHGKTMDGNSQKKYTFEVSKTSTKIDIKRAVEELLA